MTMTICENCGKKDISKEDECRSCGYVKPSVVELSPITIVFCDVCGCNYSNKCPSGHQTSNIKL